MTLQEKLRLHRVILKSGDYNGAQLMEAWCAMINAADALDAKDARIKELEGALRELSAMYSHAWDTVNGDLLMMSGSIPRFEAAHKRAEEALK